MSDRILKPTNLSVGKLDRSKLSPYKTDPDQSKFSGQSAEESRKYHTRADTDTSPRALHHTLGTKHGQASPGDHNHDGTTSKKIGPLEMDPTNPGKTRPVWSLPVGATTSQIMAFLHEFVEFREV